MVRSELHTKQREVSKTKTREVERFPGRSKTKHEQMSGYKDLLGKLGESRFYFKSGQPEMKKEVGK